MTDDKTKEDKTKPDIPLPRCKHCGKVLLHCVCTETELKK